MAYDIRPLSFSEILDRAFRVYLDNFALLIVIAAMFWIPNEILRAFATETGKGVETVREGIFLVVWYPIVHAALIVAVAAEYLERPTSILEAYRSVRPILLSFIAINFLYLVVFLACLGSALVVFKAALDIFTTLSFEAMLLAVVFLAISVVGFYFLVLWSLLDSVIVVERGSGISAFRRSRQLVLGSWWQTCGLVLVTLLSTEVPYRSLKVFWGYLPIIGRVLTLATLAVCGTYGTVVFVIYYFDRRCRTEDFDIHLLAAQVRADAQPAMTTAPASSAPA
jgi:hypothetical protein